MNAAPDRGTRAAGATARASWCLSLSRAAVCRHSAPLLGLAGDATGTTGWILWPIFPWTASTLWPSERRLVPRSVPCSSGEGPGSKQWWHRPVRYAATGEYPCRSISRRTARADSILADAGSRSSPSTSSSSMCCYLLLTAFPRGSGTCEVKILGLDTVMCEIGHKRAWSHAAAPLRSLAPLRQLEVPHPREAAVPFAQSVGRRR
jgi:hypothetical protein